MAKCYLRRMTRRDFVALGSQAITLLFFSGCKRSSEEPTATPRAQSKERILRYAHTGEFVGFDPHRLHAVSFPMFNLLYNPLVVLDRNLNPQPELAESWSFSNNFRTLTLNLARGVKFHNGRELVSDDVKANIERMQDPKNASNARPLALLVEKATATAKHTVTLDLAGTAPNIFDLLDLCYIAAPESFADLAKRGVGTGPFRLDEWHPGIPGRFARFQDYFRRERIALDLIEVYAPKDSVQMVANFENGQYDVIERFKNDDLARLKRLKDVQVQDVFAGFVADLLINTRRKPFDNKLVRQAINHAINRQQMIVGAMAGMGEPWCLPFPKNSFAYDPYLASRCTFDLKEARRLLTQAGLAKGFSFKILVSSAVLPASPLQARILQADLAQLNVKAEIADVGSSEYFDLHTKGNFDVALHQFRGANRDPQSLFLSTIPWYTKNNFSGFESPTYARLVQAAGDTRETEKRKALYADISRLLLDESFTICISSAPSMFAFYTRVQGLGWNVEGHPRYEQVTLA